MNSDPMTIAMDTLRASIELCEARYREKPRRAQMIDASAIG
jgi:hypothetical protein